MLRLYVNRPDLAAVVSHVEIGTCPIVRVIETETGWTWSEHNPVRSARRDEGRPFLRRAIRVCRNELSVPMQLLRGVSIVAHFHRHRLAFLETQ
jgi:hypothetical protein